ncbi:hypothetical protein [Chromatium okenii]|uniref:hypothetical protein n=1 Tax=Chromatium okenii TaxID=61644 RepID=UPI003D6AF106
MTELIHELLIHQAQRTPANAALRASGIEWSYQALAEAVHNAAALFGAGFRTRRTYCGLSRKAPRNGDCVIRSSSGWWRICSD